MGRGKVDVLDHANGFIVAGETTHRSVAMAGLRGLQVLSVLHWHHPSLLWASSHGACMEAGISPQHVYGMEWNGVEMEWKGMERSGMK